MASTPSPTNRYLAASAERRADMPSTHWSLIFAAAGSGTEAQTALAKLYELYWPPVYRFVSRRKSNPEDAQEFCQQFFADLIARRDIEKLDPALGSFHAWLYRCLRNALFNSHRQMSRRPSLVSRDAIDLNSFCALDANPEQEFIHQCALAVYCEARTATREQLRHVRDCVFNAAVPVPGSELLEQAELAKGLGISETAFRTRVKEVRIKFRATLYRQLARTTGTSNVAEEIRALCEAISEPTGEVRNTHERIRIRHD